MRDLVINYLKSLNLKSFKVSLELPFEPNGTALHIKNPKSIYVDVEQYEKEPFIKVMNGKDINIDDTIVNVYFATDAKQLSQEYTNVVSQIRQAVKIDTEHKYFRETSNISTEYEKDLLVTIIELRYSMLTTS